jgi:hypothetical protein
MAIGIAVACPLATGCADARYYKMPIHQPWPDERAASLKNPAFQEIALSAKTIQWHRRMNPLLVAAHIDQMLRKKPTIQYYRRIEYLPNLRRQNDDERALPVIEVKLDATFLAMPKPSPLTVQWSEQPFNIALRQLSEILDKQIVFADGIPPQPPVNRYVRGEDPRMVLAEILLDRDLFFEPVLGAPQEIRSFEYQSEADFAAQIRRTANRIESAYPKNGPLTIVKFDDWLRENRGAPRVIWQIDDEGEPEPVILNLSPDPNKAKIHLRWILRDKIR